MAPERRPFFILLAACTLFITLSACNRPTPRPIPQEGTPVPHFTLKDLAEKPFDLDKLSGNVIVLNFWAPWCKPCRTEMPSLQRLSTINNTGKKLKIFTVLYGSNTGPAADFMRQNGLTLPVLVDGNLDVARSYGVTGVPETFIIGKKGILRKKVIGPMNFESPEALTFFEKLLNE
ncbi:MAG: TlpA family protein disulfide reductase [Deltaproteobacteria bacterium]|nr:TlpA family protein disulfide reductase [Deltaproteobacteria bacterium]